MSVFKRISDITRAELHSLAEQFRTPVMLTEESINDLKQSLARAMAGLADMKSQTVRTRRDADNNRRLAEDYERQAIRFLQRMQDGDLDRAEAEQKATDALVKKGDHAVEAEKFGREADRLEQATQELQDKVNEIKTVIRRLENELLTLRARARTAEAAREAGRISAEYDPSPTIALLERMEKQVEEEEALAQAYGEMADSTENFDQEIDKALGNDTGSQAARSLEKMKKDLGLID